MTEQLKLKLNDSKATHWGIGDCCLHDDGSYVNDVVAPLKTMLKRTWLGRVPISDSDSLPVVIVF